MNDDFDNTSEPHEVEGEIMSDRETKRCAVCYDDIDEGKRIACGHVLTHEGEEILAAYCSETCYDKTKRPGFVGTWVPAMGKMPVQY